MLYHGTSTEWVESVTAGIVGKGGNTDFSIGSAFYLNKSFSMARKWAEARARGTSYKPAVVVFALPTDFLQAPGIIQHTFDRNNTTSMNNWQKVCILVLCFNNCLYFFLVCSVLS